MLSSLRLKNFILFDDTQLSFSSGFSVITGETGSGKSIVIDAIAILLGKPMSEEVIKSGADYAIVEGVFHVDTKKHPQFNSIVDEEGTLLLTRKLIRGKKSVSRLNSETFSLKKIRHLLTEILAIVGQHDYLDLMKEDVQLQLLDSFSPAEIQNEKQQFLLQYDQYMAAKAALLSHEGSREERASKIDFLSFQISDIEQHGFKQGEDDLLEEKKKLLQNQYDYKEAFQALKQFSKTLSHTSEEMIPYMEKLSASYPVIATMLDKHKDLSLEFSEFYADLSIQSDVLEELDVSDLDSIESRLDTLFKLRQKYHARSLAELLNKLQAMKSELDQLRSSLQSDSSLKDAFEFEKKRMLSISKTLSQARKQHAKQLEVALINTLSELGLACVRFTVKIEFNFDFLTRHGADHVTFLISTNPGEPLKRLSKVASGGELSRIMLAMQSLSDHIQPRSTLVFDEIDTGVGGVTAVKMGEFLKKIAASSQLLAITHLPQIAQYADHHISVEKKISDCSGELKTVAYASILPSQERDLEMSRMAGTTHSSLRGA